MLIASVYSLLTEFASSKTLISSILSCFLASRSKHVLVIVFTVKPSLSRNTANLSIISVFIALLYAQPYKKLLTKFISKFASAKQDDNNYLGKSRIRKKHCCKRSGKKAGT